MSVRKIIPWSALRRGWKEQNARGNWTEMLLLAGIICSVASGIQPAQPCALPLLPKSLFQTCGINPSAKASCGHRALSPKRLGQELFWRITSSHGDQRAILRLVSFFFSRQNWKFKHHVTGTVSPGRHPPTSFLAVCLCAACYFHHNGATLTMQAACQLPLLPDAPMGFGCMHMLRGQLNDVCVQHSHKHSISALAVLIS